MESRESDGDRRAQSGDDEFHDAIWAQQRFGLVLIPPIGPSPDDGAAAAEAEHEDGDHERRGLDGGAEDVPELADPDDLVDQAADARAEKQEIQRNRGHGEGRRTDAARSGAGSSD